MDPHGTLPLPMPPGAGEQLSLSVRVLSGPDKDLHRVVESSRVIIGRAEDADVPLRDPAVSLYHVELTVKGQGIRVKDLQSRNGVRASGIAIEQAVVPPGCTLSLGTSTVRVELAGAFARPRSSAGSFGGLLGESPAMRDLYARLERLARNDLSLLIQGETGTGKELVARALHREGPRARRPFVVLNCTAVPLSLAESMLFGHDKGAFTGAERRAGLFEAADGGVLLLDEIGDLPLEIQPKLLRSLQQREVVPLGSTQPRPVDVRVLCATHRDLRAAVNGNLFREDLYYRLAQATIWLPPLRDRREDIPLLVQRFLADLPPEVPAARGVSQEALGMLCRRDWRGNVRELQGTVQRLAQLSDGPVLTAKDVSEDDCMAPARAAPAAALLPEPPADEGVILPYKDAKRTLVDDFERSYLQRLLERTAGNLSQAAELAAIERHNLRDLLKKHGLYRRPE